MGEVPETVLNIPFPFKGGSEGDVSGGGISGISDIDQKGMEENQIEKKDSFPFFNR